MAKKQAPAAEGAAAEGKGKGKLKLIIIIIVALLLVIGASVGATWFLLGKKSAEPEHAAPAAPAAPVHLAAVYQALVPAFVVNYNADGRQRYMQVTVTLMGRDQAQMDALKAQLPQVRNQLVMLFSGQDFNSLLTPVGKEMLRQQATSKVQELAKKLTGQTAIEQVLFTNLVLQ